MNKKLLNTGLIFIYCFIVKITYSQCSYPSNLKVYYKVASTMFKSSDALIELEYYNLSNDSTTVYDELVDNYMYGFNSNFVIEIEKKVANKYVPIPCYYGAPLDTTIINLKTITLSGGKHHKLEFNLLKYAYIFEEGTYTIQLYLKKIPINNNNQCEAKYDISPKMSFTVKKTIKNLTLRRS